MSILKGLQAEAKSVVLNPNFRKGSVGAVDASAFLIEDVGFGREIRLEKLRIIVEEAMKRFPPKKSDPWLAPRVHATLRLTRREAADKRIWSYLTIVEFSDYVRWRWRDADDEESQVPIDRFIGEDSKNALARLWWAAELTRNGPNYAATEKAMSNSRFANSWQHLDVLHHRPAALAIVDFLTRFGGKGTTDRQGQDMAKALNLALRTLALDALAENSATDAEAIRTWCKEDIDETKMMNDLPIGPDEALVPSGKIAMVRDVLDRLAGSIDLGSVKYTRPSRGGKQENSEEIETAVTSTIG